MPSLKNVAPPPTRLRATGEELLHHPEWGRCELIGGEVVQLVPAGASHGDSELFVARMIGNYVARHRLGKVYGADTGFYLQRQPDTVRGPDCMFVAAARVPPGLVRGYLPFPPDLAVEIVDPDDPPLATFEKAQSFADAGVKLVWVIDYVSQRAMVYEQGKPPRLLPADGVLDGGHVLPGFKLRLKKIWQAVGVPATATLMSDVLIRITRCPSCGSPRIKRVRRNVTRQYRGKAYTVHDLEFHECPDCGEKLYGPEAMRKIEAVSPAYKSRAHGRSKVG